LKDQHAFLSLDGVSAAGFFKEHAGADFAVAERAGVDGYEGCGKAFRNAAPKFVSDYYHNQTPFLPLTALNPGTKLFGA
jgi:hypothetical protein